MQRRFDSAWPDMKIIKVSCYYCYKTFSRKAGQYKEAIKFDWKQFCSRNCLSKSKVTSENRICSNVKCAKKIVRMLSVIRKSKSGKLFCSTACAAKINNGSRKITSICTYCHNKFDGNRKFCTVQCSGKNRKLSIEKKKDNIIRRLNQFFKNNGRIPVKKEMYGIYKTARLAFGTWNNAIKAAGYESNPVLFAKHFIAKDGHPCDSFSEKIIDDWLYNKNIEHQRKFPYGLNKMTADFKIEPNIVIEFFGLAGVQKRYDELVRIKKTECKKLNLKLIEIYPGDLYPKNNLEKILDIAKL